MASSTGVLSDKIRGRKRRLWNDPVYRNKLIALFPVTTTDEIARMLEISKRTIERDAATLKRMSPETLASLPGPATSNSGDGLQSSDKSIVAQPSPDQSTLEV